MKEILLTISSKGQVTIPVQVRRWLGVGKNQKIALVIDEKKGDIRLKVPRYPDVASLSGAAGSLGKRLSWKEMRDIAREDHWKRKSRRTP
jgi:bifunctional DNA-binding transcriptional regulator/antitoxin component of YhaV-PrlF toxin-antitoxin module